MGLGTHAWSLLKTGQQGPVLYKDNKSVNDAARPPEGGPAEADGRLPWSIDHPALTALLDSSLNSQRILIANPFIMICPSFYGI